MNVYSFQGMADMHIFYGHANEGQAYLPAKFSTATATSKYAF
jgi:hypothetical protein